jgi:hypothetical protein
VLRSCLPLIYLLFTSCSAGPIPSELREHPLGSADAPLDFDSAGLSFIQIMLWGVHSIAEPADCQYYYGVLLTIVTIQPNA